MPDPYMKVHLSVMGITSSVLYLIRDFFEKCNYSPTIVVPSNKDGESAFRSFVGLPEFEFIDRIGEEELLLLTLACHKLHIKTLQNFLYAKIASIVEFEDYGSAAEAFGLDVSDDEHLNNYLKLESKWAS